MKHRFRKDASGKIDRWAYENDDFCNGVVCERCGESMCVHCSPNYMELECTAKPDDTDKLEAIKEFIKKDMAEHVEMQYEAIKQHDKLNEIRCTGYLQALDMLSMLLEEEN